MSYVPQTPGANGLAAILEQVSDGLIVLDAGGRVGYVNTAAERLLRRSRDDLLAKTLDQAFPDAVGTQFHVEYDRAVQQQAPVEFEALEPRAQRWFWVRVVPMSAGAITICFRDVSERRHADESARGSQERFRRIFDESPVGMMLVSNDDRMNQLNGTLCRMLGYTPDELIGRTWMEITHPDDISDGMEATERLLKGAAPFYHRDKRYVRKDGKVIWGRVSLSMVRSDSGTPTHRLVMVEDVTERRRFEEERDHLLRSEQAARAEAETANRRKDQFLAVLSHELRTPLTPVLARLELLKREQGLSPSVRDSLNRIRRSVELEANLIDDLLDITRISQGKLRLSLEVVDAHDKIKDALEIYHKDIRDKHLNIRLDLAAQEHEVKADPVRLEQIFWNLISNAVKYTSEGGTITIRTRTVGGLEPGIGYRVSGNGSETPPPEPRTATSSETRNPKPETRSLVVEVIDTGIGIQPEMMGRLFRAFEQGEQALTRRFGGLGLGVTITKALVEMHGGKISARSEGLNKGATFTVELPVFVAPVAEVIPPAPPPRRKTRILLVEDNQDTLRILARLLRSMGHDVKTASNVAEATQIAGHAGIDLVISDIGLPDGSGWELMRQLKSERPIRGVALSGFSTEQDVQKSREAGFEAHLTKPIDLQKLDEVICQVAP